MVASSSRTRRSLLADHFGGQLPKNVPAGAPQTCIGVLDGFLNS